MVMTCAGLTALLPTSALAAGCYASSCNGKDPHATGCDRDAQTVASATDGTAQIHLRWSNTCQANWTQILNVSLLGAHFWVANKNKVRQDYTLGRFDAASGWTNMVDGHNISAQACDDRICTDWK
jgi:hypothetical protein